MKFASSLAFTAIICVSMALKARAALTSAAICSAIAAAGYFAIVPANTAYRCGGLHRSRRVTKRQCSTAVQTSLRSSNKPAHSKNTSTYVHRQANTCRTSSASWDSKAVSCAERCAWRPAHSELGALTVLEAGMVLPLHAFCNLPRGSALVLLLLDLALRGNRGNRGNKVSPVQGEAQMYGLPRHTGYALQD